MKTFLGFSILLNAVLLGGVLFLWTKGHDAVRSRVVTVAAPPPPVVSRAFRWSQLDSPDYHTYVKNLRAIGCPEGSVRAIVTADADAVFNRWRLSLEQKLSEMANGNGSKQLSPADSEPVLRAKLERLPEEETSLIAELLGLSKAPALMAATPPAPVLPKPPLTAANEPAALPLVFQDFDPAALNLSDEQRQTIAGLRQNFLDQIGGPNQNPGDPTYLNRWQHAQIAMDSMLQGMLGADVYIKFQTLQMMAQNQAAQQPPEN